MEKKMNEPKRVYGRKYELVFDQNSQCYQVLEWPRNSYPAAYGASIMTFTEEGILSRLFGEDD